MSPAHHRCSQDDKQRSTDLRPLTRHLPRKFVSIPLMFPSDFSNDLRQERELEEKAKLLRPRRATSPQPTRSPAFSLFPQTPSRLGVRDASPSPLGLQRSNTSPAALSPSRPSFEPQADEGMSATLAGPAPHIPFNPRPRDESTT